MAVENVNSRNVAILSASRNYPITDFTQGIISREEVRGWPVYDDPFSYYNAYFNECGMSPKAALSSINRPLAVLDLMSGAGMIKDLSAVVLSNGGQFEKGLSVGLTHHGAENLPAHLAHISGDLRQEHTWEEINDAAGDGFNCIFLRAYNGWITIRKERPDLSARLFAEVLGNSISLCQSNAHIFLQAPPWFMHCADDLIRYLASYEGIGTNPMKREQNRRSNLGKERFGLHIQGRPQLSSDFVVDVLEIYHGTMQTVYPDWITQQVQSFDTSH